MTQLRGWEIKLGLLNCAVLFQTVNLYNTDGDNKADFDRILCARLRFACYNSFRSHKNL